MIWGGEGTAVNSSGGVENQQQGPPPLHCSLSSGARWSIFRPNNSKGAKMILKFFIRTYNQNRKTWKVQFKICFHFFNRTYSSKVQNTKGGHSLLFSRIDIRSLLFFYHGSQLLLCYFWHFQVSLFTTSLLKIMQGSRYLLVNGQGHQIRMG